jgi:shikimate kinase
MSKFVSKKYDVSNPGEQVRHETGTGRAAFDWRVSNIFFIGLRGSGKTTLAQETARLLGASCVDTDSLVEKEAGTSIADLVHREGWESFRDLEQRVLRRACAGRGQAVATGGGVVLRRENRQLMRESGFVFYLLASVDLLHQRLQSVPESGKRPSMGHDSLREELSACMREREPLYLETLHFILQAQKPVEELAQDVLSMLNPVAGGES